MSKIKPLAGYLVVESLPKQTTTASGLFLPETAQEEKSGQGKIIEIGPSWIFPDGREMSVPVKIGEIVVFKKWGSEDIKVDNKNYRIVKFEDLMAVIEG